MFAQQSKKLFTVLTLAGILLMISASLALAQGDVLTAPPKNYELVQGWYQGSKTFYYEFGTNTPATGGGTGINSAPIYVLVTGFDAGGNPQVVEGQHNIVDVIPGEAGYSDLWQVTFVTVPADYQANTIKSADALLEAGYEQTPTETYVNCPIVPAGSTLADEGPELVQGWYKGQEVFYFGFPENRPVTAPIYVLVTGFDAGGNPQPVAGQANIVDVVPGDENYSAFWNVNFVTVPEDYQANSITSAGELLGMGYDIRQTDIVVNCPIIRTEEAMMAGDEAMMAEGDKDEAMMAGDEAMMAGEDKDETMMAESDAMMGEGEAMAAEAPAELPATGGVTDSGYLLAVVAMLGGLGLAGLGWTIRVKNRQIH